MLLYESVDSLTQWTKFLKELRSCTMMTRSLNLKHLFACTHIFDHVTKFRVMLMIIMIMIIR